MKEINLYLIRHGETVWNVSNQMQGSKDTPLTENGITGAKITGKFLADVPFVKAYSSTQQRAIDTRNYILAENHKKPHAPTAELADLCEMDFGTWEGEFVDDLADLPSFKIYQTAPEHYDPTENKGEYYLEVLTRMQNAIERIVTENESGNVLVVSHGSALRQLLYVLGGGDWRDHRNEKICAKMFNTSISLVKYQQEQPQTPGRFTVKSYNTVDHLAN